MLCPCSVLGPIFLPYWERMKRKMSPLRQEVEKLGYEEAIWNTSPMKIKN